MANAAPTGCYKCGRPGHWSRDCPSSAPSNPPNPNSTATGTNPANHNNVGAATSSKQPYAFKTSSANSNAANPKPAVAKPKRAPRTRPKLTPELLLSNDGLGYLLARRILPTNEDVQRCVLVVHPWTPALSHGPVVLQPYHVLRHFSPNFKFRGHGHEVSDLGKLIGLYTEWHSRLLPYYSFDQFVKKIEQLGTTRRVKMTIRDLRERVANGGDLTKLHESAVEHDTITQTQDDAPETMDTDELSHHQEHQSTNNNDTSDMHEDLLHEVYEKAVEEPSISLPSGVAAAAGSSKEQTDQGAKSTDSSSAFQMTEEQRARMEERRLTALEKAAARKRLSTAT